MPPETQELALGIGVGIILLASVLAMLGLKGLFRLIPPLLVFAGAGFLGYSFYMTRDKQADLPLNGGIDGKIDNDLLD
ncbi:MAG: hypothetical protein ACE5OZ_11000 [Candidatus Heimdallarchaeota archaeon]